MNIKIESDGAPLKATVNNQQSVEQVLTTHEEEAIAKLIIGDIPEGITVEQWNATPQIRKDRHKRFTAFKTKDADTIRLINNVQRVADQNMNILITGDSGTGKELVARMLHGSRRGKFCAINCAGIPETLIESQLFGHVRGTFTGAVANWPGYISFAAQGTMFLDEIGDMPMDMQAKLLRAIDSGKFMAVGGDVEKDVECRWVCATNRPLRKLTLLDPPRFRPDLYWRIAELAFHIKPLAERPSDVQIIAQHIAAQYDLHMPTEEECKTIEYSEGGARQIKQYLMEKTHLV